jgi:hypothetical protein
VPHRDGEKDESDADLLKRASWRAEVLFKQRGSFRTIVWLTEDADGHRAQFETACSAPVEVSNAEVLSALGREMAADFRRDAVGRGAVCGGLSRSHRHHQHYARR